MVSCYSVASGEWFRAIAALLSIKFYLWNLYFHFYLQWKEIVINSLDNLMNKLKPGEFALEIIWLKKKAIYD